jgi:cytochrome c biogenesis protein
MVTEILKDETAAVNASAATPPAPLSKRIDLSLFSSLKLFFVLISLSAITILIGSWCPQEAAVGRDKVIEQFGPEWANRMIEWGIADIFHTPFFLGLIGLLTVNLVCASCTRVFPKLKLLQQAMPFLSGNEIEKMPVHFSVDSTADAATTFGALISRLRRAGYSVSVEGDRLTAHWGKIGRTAASVTHVGLLTLLTGVTITSWTGFAGFSPVLLHSSLSFDDSNHSKTWIGHLPTWKVRVDATRREDYENGDPKQWYSTLSVVDNKSGKVLKRQEISVNNPLSYDGVDIYQSSWGLHGLTLLFNGHPQFLQLNQMSPRVHAAVLPLDQRTVMIFSVRDPNAPIRVFAKIPEWPAPKMLALLPQGKPTRFGSVEITYHELVPQSGLQYKSDPGLPITYLAFGLIITGVLMASIPFRQVWAAVESGPNGARLVFGGNSKKAKAAFARAMTRMQTKLQEDVVACQTSK